MDRQTSLLRVFVYGTLKRGFFNSHLLSRSSNFLGEGFSREKFLLFIGGRYAIPYILPREQSRFNVKEYPGYRIQGEVWSVSKETLKDLDDLEGVPAHYTRESVQVDMGGRIMDCFLYLMNQNFMNDLLAKEIHQPLFIDKYDMQTHVERYIPPPLRYESWQAEVWPQKNRCLVSSPVDLPKHALHLKSLGPHVFQDLRDLSKARELSSQGNIVSLHSDVDWPDLFEWYYVMLLSALVRRGGTLVIRLPSGHHTGKRIHQLRLFTNAQLTVLCEYPDGVWALRKTSKNCMIVLSGFGRFHGVPRNPTESLVRALSNDPRVAKCNVLETSLQGVDAVFEEWQEEVRDKHVPVVFLHLGVKCEATHFHLERTAYNLLRFRVPDERGNQPVNGRISEALSDAIDTELPLEEILSQSSEPVEISTDPGRFLCNYVYFRSLGLTDGTQHQSLFLHTPSFSLVPEHKQHAFLRKLVHILHEKSSF